MTSFGEKTAPKVAETVELSKETTGPPNNTTSPEKYNKVSNDSVTSDFKQPRPQQQQQTKNQQQQPQQKAIHVEPPKLNIVGEYKPKDNLKLDIPITQPVASANKQIQIIEKPAPPENNVLKWIIIILILVNIIVFIYIYYKMYVINNSKYGQATFVVTSDTVEQGKCYKYDYASSVQVQGKISFTQISFTANGKTINTIILANDLTIDGVETTIATNVVRYKTNDTIKGWYLIANPTIVFLSDPTI